ncbi:MAG: hypothetical protein A3G27_19990 [Betaproteobacteria bacterium RIFCSPLOWO2_12_FULL_66_14]|nr:MAG: hypothetical protein A3G27_19990 [Betaproteobacteria bacterium RIFCSPLOWO2_12_FULL_66_14]
MRKDPEIYCPECRYRPRPEDRWQCVPSCGTTWHTFWTGGVCPGCGYRWTTTQCPACSELSPHQDWYHYPEGERSFEELNEAVPQAED